MSHFKAVIPALIAIFALSALSSSSALGAVKGELVNKSGGTVKGVIKASQKTGPIFETLARIKITCEIASGEGEAISTVRFVTKNGVLKKCIKSTGGSCKSKGAAPEEIVVGQLNGLVVTNPAETEDLGLVELGTEIEFECSEVKIKLKLGGKFLGQITPQKTFTLAFTGSNRCSTAGMAELTEYKEAGVEKTLSEAEGLLAKIGATGAWEGSCRSGEGAATLAEEGELI